MIAQRVIDEPVLVGVPRRLGAIRHAEQTVKFHLTNIYRKLNLANRTEAARYAYQHGLVESPLVEIA